MNTISWRRRPSSTRASPEVVSTMMSVAASRGRSARAFPAAPDADLASSPVISMPPPKAYSVPRVSPARQVLARVPAGVARPGCPRGHPSVRPCAPGHEPVAAPAHTEAGAAPRPGREHFETQRPGRGNRFDEPDPDGIAEPIAGAGAIADQGMLLLAVPVIVLADGRSRHEAIGAAFGQPHEQSGARHPG